MVRTSLHACRSRTTRGRFLSLALAASALALTACASSAMSSDATPVIDAMVSPTDAMTVSTDAPVPLSAARVRDARVGIWFSRSIARNGGTGAVIVEAHARFTEWQRPEGACTHLATDACAMDDCRYAADEFGFPSSQRFLSAGTITYTLPARTANPMFPLTIVIQPDALQGYTHGGTSLTGGTGWFANEPVELIAVGSTVPAFRANVGAPVDAQLRSPSLQRFTNGATTTFHNNADLSIEWVPSERADSAMFARVAIRQTTPAGTRSHVVSIECKFPLTARTGAIPASMMSHLETPSQSRTTFTFNAFAFTTVNAGTTPVTVEAFGGGEFATATVTP